MKAADLADRDGWTCWLCGGEVDPELPSTAPWAGSVDHVVPRSRGGRTHPDNLRLAHRRCNSRRADTLPELEWPPELHPLEPGDLWRTIARLVRRPDAVEIAALFPTEEMARAGSTWAVEQACRFVGGEWTGWVEATGTADVHAVKLRQQGATDPGRPRSARDRRRGARRGTSSRRR